MLDNHNFLILLANHEFPILLDNDTFPMLLDNDTLSPGSHYRAPLLTGVLGRALPPGALS